MWQRRGQVPTTVKGGSTYKDLVQWALAMQKQGLTVVRYMIIKNPQEIHRYMFGSMRYVGSFGLGWCNQFMI